MLKSQMPRLRRREAAPTARCSTPRGQLIKQCPYSGAEHGCLGIECPGGSDAPLQNAKFAIVFHGAAVDGILDDGHYTTKFGTPNPNLKAIAKMKKDGVEFFVCGQYLAGERIDSKTLTPDVQLAANALLVLMQYQNKGYALMSF